MRPHQPTEKVAVIHRRAWPAVPLKDIHRRSAMIHTLRTRCALADNVELNAGACVGEQPFAGLRRFSTAEHCRKVAVITRKCLRASLQDQHHLMLVPVLFDFLYWKIDA